MRPIEDYLQRGMVQRWDNERQEGSILFKLTAPKDGQGLAKHETLRFPPERETIAFQLHEFVHREERVPQIGEEVVFFIAMNDNHQFFARRVEDLQVFWAERDVMEKYLSKKDDESEELAQAANEELNRLRQGEGIRLFDVATYLQDYDKVYERYD